MLRSTKELVGYHLLATDGRIGRCEDMLFDDRYWRVQYVVVDTARWLPGRRVIVAPALFGEPRWRSQEIPVGYSMQQIEEAPPLESDAPVSLRYEKKWFEHDQPVYSTPVGPMGTPIVADVNRMDPAEKEQAKAIAEWENDATHLRSIEEVTGYALCATDGDVGHVEEFVLDDETWRLRYLVVETHRWLPGGKVLLSLDWVRRMSWPRREVVVGLPVRLVKESPKYTPSEPINREYEARLYDFYGRPHSWQDR